MATSIVPKMKYEAMEEEAQYIAVQAERRVPNVQSIQIRNDLNRYPSEFKNANSGLIEIIVSYTSGYAAKISWSQYTYGGDKLLWELTLLYGDNVAYNEDYPSPIGWLDSTDILENLVKISRY